MAEMIRANADNDLKFRDTMIIKKPKKPEEMMEAGCTPPPPETSGTTELFTE